MRGDDPETLSAVLPSRSAPETEAIGERLAELVSRGDVVCLYGDLGAGKTTLVRGLHRGLGCQGRVRSPSFTTLFVYTGPLPLHHFDLFRYEAAGAAFLDEFAEWLDGDGVAVIEWADRFGELAPRPRLDVRFETVGEERRLVCRAVGPGWSDRVAALATDREV